jgi:hypothetical protein
MVTFETEAAQGELEMVHAKMFVPNPKPVIEVVGDNELVIVPDPETKVQTPVPTVAVLAAISVFGEEMQSIGLGPAFEMVGISLTTIATVDEEGEQGELEMVHWKIFVPNPKPVIEVVGESELVIVPDPEIKVQAPVPILAAFAVMIVVGEEIQSV